MTPLSRLGKPQQMQKFVTEFAIVPLRTTASIHRWDPQNLFMRNDYATEHPLEHRVNPTTRVIVNLNDVCPLMKSLAKFLIQHTNPLMQHDSKYL